ncbi:MAG: glycosyltransferase family 39 protein [Lentisphaeria bacterium]|nr:glycosyltransferase family 39 protein [Lentisphaeria bacterium]
MDVASGKKSWADRPELVLFFFILLSLAIWTLQCSLLQSVLGIDIFETIVWGEQLQWGHSKHPPLSGWIGYFCTWATGHSDWGLYLAAQLCIGLGVFFTFKTARMFFDRFRAATAALLLYFLLYYTPSEMKFCTYLVEIDIAPAAAFLLLKSLRENRWNHWCAFGAVCGLGILNKYSFGLIAVAFVLVMLTRREYRRRYASVGPYLAVLVAIAVTSPHLKWLYEHDFVCFRHVGDRLDEEHNILMPLYVLAAALYPVLMEGLVVVLTLAPLPPRRGAEWLRSWRALDGWTRGDRNFEALHFSGVVSFLPGAVYLALSLAGTDIILMWLCSVASLSGIFVMALCPVEVDRRFFQRFSLLLAGFIGVVFDGVTADLLLRTADGVHMRPAPVVAAAEKCWRKSSDEPIPLVIGGLRFAALVDHYSSAHPPVCDPEDEVMIALYRDRIRERGALLVDAKIRDFDGFLKRVEVPVRFQKHRVSFSARFGKKKNRGFVVGVLPPGTVVKCPSPQTGGELKRDQR